MSDTPRTDQHASFGCVKDTFARQLERELAAERALANRLAHCIYDLQYEYRPIEAKEAFEEWKAVRQ